MMRWACQRGCGAAGSKTYDSAAKADRYARAFGREDGRDRDGATAAGLRQRADPGADVALVDSPPSR